eukprot:SAG31_NODE_563_length_14061_cov_15.714224_6_plen_43_part_00
MLYYSEPPERVEEGIKGNLGSESRGLGAVGAVLARIATLAAW